MIPFTYLVKHIPTNRYYYGVKFKKGCHPNDLWTKYFTSSKKVKSLIRKYGKKSFLFEVRKTFKTQKQARRWEHKVLRRMKVIYRDDFLNLSDSLHIDPRIISKSKMGNKNHMYGKKMTEEHKKKIKDTLVKRYKKLPHHSKGRKHTPAFLRFLSKLNSGKKNPMYGKKLSKEARKKMSIAKYKHWRKVKTLA